MINIFQPDSESGALSFMKKHHTIMKFRIQMIRSYRTGFGPNGRRRVNYFCFIFSLFES